jgi:archaellum biogenesis ATPase FlaH
MGAMRHLGELLSDLDLPRGEAPAATLCCDGDLVHDLGADLPAGHLHLWGGPPGAGKTSFLLSMLYGAAQGGRRVAYATYHLPAQSLALRLLAMTADVKSEDLLRGTLDAAVARRAGVARDCLARLPIWILEARGLSVASLADRLVRMPFRAEVLAVDYLQAVQRAPGEELADAMKAFAAMAAHLHVAVVCTLQASDDGTSDLLGLAHRAGWLAPSGGSGLRRAEVIGNRYGARPQVPLRLDPETGTLHRLDA